MFIQTEETPDDSAMRFLPGRAVLGSGRAAFADEADAARSPLAAALFRVEGVAGVTLGAEDITVRKAEGADWQVLKPPLLGVIMEHFVADRPVLIDAAPPDTPAEADDPAAAKLREIVETRIAPGLAEAGAQVAFLGYADGVVRLGVGAGDRSQPLFALKVKIENTLRYYVADVARVEIVQDSAPDAPAGGAGLETPEGLAVQRVLDERINPAIAAHGGYISLIDVEGDRAYIRLEGGCQGCGMADVTLKQGVEVEILREVPAITAVLDVTDHASGTNPFYQPSRK